MVHKQFLGEGNWAQDLIESPGRVTILSRKKDVGISAIVNVVITRSPQSTTLNSEVHQDDQLVYSDQQTYTGDDAVSSALDQRGKILGELDEKYFHGKIW